MQRQNSLLGKQISRDFVDKQGGHQTTWKVTGNRKMTKSFVGAKPSRTGGHRTTWKVSGNRKITKSFVGAKPSLTGGHRTTF